MPEALWPISERFAEAAEVRGSPPSVREFADEVGLARGGVQKLDTFNLEARSNACLKDLGFGRLNVSYSRCLEAPRKSGGWTMTNVSRILALGSSMCGILRCLEAPGRSGGLKGRMSPGSWRWEAQCVVFYGVWRLLGGPVFNQVEPS